MTSLRRPHPSPPTLGTRLALGHDPSSVIDNALRIVNRAHGPCMSSAGTREGRARPGRSSCGLTGDIDAYVERRDRASSFVAPQRGYDEPAILSYAISSFCPTSADGLHLWMLFDQPRCRSFFGQYLDNAVGSQRGRQAGQRPSAGWPIQKRLHARATKSGCDLPTRRCSAS